MKSLKDKTKRRPPDNIFGFSYNYGLMNVPAETTTTVLKDQIVEINTIYLTGKRLQLRSNLHHSGSRTSKKTR